ncbi:MAG TPA: glycosyltransferase [Chthoniobacterales bacterium]|nr:glycosyltransferase [Chthoniobacterales bacterium]
MTDSARLPRLLYLGDVGVESSYHGSALLFRLLQAYPAERLMILEAAPWRSHPDRRLPGVSYHAFPIGWGRLLNSRFSRQYGSVVLGRMPGKWREVRRQTERYKPEAVLTVVHGYSWVAAAEFARVAKLPLHLILHDDWLSSLQVLERRKGPAEKLFASHYRRATTRFCVSPAMAERYRERYGVESEVLYPIRAANCPVASGPAPTKQRDVFVVGYAGTINGDGYVARLNALAKALSAMKGKLMIYGPTSAEQAKSIGLDEQNIFFRGLIPSEQLIDELRRETDLLFAPMSFRSEDRTNMELSFPSKLTDYTAVGLPLLINGPSYCSAVRWARQNPGVAEVVESEDVESIAKTLRALEAAPDRRRELGAAALSAGEQWFSHQSVSTQFLDAISAQSEILK